MVEVQFFNHSYSFFLRNNLSNIEKFIEVYSPILSENHVFILQLKMWLIEGLNRLPYNNTQCKDVLLKKISLIKEIIRGMAPFEAPYSYINGLLHLELTDTIIQKLFSMFSQTIENLNQVPLDPLGLIQGTKVRCYYLILISQNLFSIVFDFRIYIFFKL